MFARHFQRGYCRRCAKPLVVRSAFFRECCFCQFRLIFEMYFPFKSGTTFHAGDERSCPYYTLRRGYYRCDIRWHIYVHYSTIFSFYTFPNLVVSLFLVSSSGIHLITLEFDFKYRFFTKIVTIHIGRSIFNILGISFTVKCVTTSK